MPTMETWTDEERWFTNNMLLITIPSLLTFVLSVLFGCSENFCLLAYGSIWAIFALKQLCREDLMGSTPFVCYGAPLLMNIVANLVVVVLAVKEQPYVREEIVSAIILTLTILWSVVRQKKDLSLKRAFGVLAIQLSFTAVTLYSIVTYYMSSHQ